MADSTNSTSIHVSNFSSWLDEFGMYETLANIFPEDLDKIKATLMQLMQHQDGAITAQDVRSTLKSLRLHKYYEYTAAIVYAITGSDRYIIKLDAATKQEMVETYRQLMAAHTRVIGVSRSPPGCNFVARKILERLNHPEHVKFPYLNSVQKLEEQTKWWDTVSQST